MCPLSPGLEAQQTALLLRTSVSLPLSPALMHRGTVCALGQQQHNREKNNLYGSATFSHNQTVILRDLLVHNSKNVSTHATCLLFTYMNNCGGLTLGKHAQFLVLRWWRYRCHVLFLCLYLYLISACALLCGMTLTVWSITGFTNRKPCAVCVVTENIL